MNELLNRREELSKKGVEVFVLKGQKTKYYTETYFQNSSLPKLQFYLEGDDYNELLENTIVLLEDFINKK